MKWVPEIATNEFFIIAGLQKEMSLADNRVAQLWQEFFRVCTSAAIKIPKDLISAAKYPPDYFDQFQPQLVFDKWAGFAIPEDTMVPEGLSALEIPAGLYAKFHYKGASSDSSIYQYIFDEWLPDSPYRLDSRPHFELLGAAYRNNEPESEEYIFIPIAVKA